MSYEDKQFIIVLLILILCALAAPHCLTLVCG